MKAVNLIPADVQRTGRRALRLAPPTYGLFGVLAVVLAMVVMFVLASNKVDTDQAQINGLQSAVQQAQSESAALTSYTQFASMAEARISTVRTVAATRFDWSTALSNLARVVPANTSLQSLTATVVPGVSVAGSASGSGLRGDEPGPAFDMTGCTGSQDDVALLISRLRAMPGVQRVALSSSTKPAAGGMVSAASSNGGCPANDPVFSLTVFFTPVNGAGPTGATNTPSGTGTTATGTSTTGTSATATTTSTTTATTPATTGAAK